MVDLIFAVEDPVAWHRQNLKVNKEHYSILKYFGPRAIAMVQQSGPGLYFNPMCTLKDVPSTLRDADTGVSMETSHDVVVKYGVIGIDELCDDLLHWPHFYAAGRLHKPVRVLKDHSDVSLANDHNLDNVVKMALLCLPEEFTELDLYTTITEFSYLGDIRRNFGAENPNKVPNIVRANIDGFRRLYERPLKRYLENQKGFSGILRYASEEERRQRMEALDKNKGNDSHSSDTDTDTDSNHSKESSVNTSSSSSSKSSDSSKDNNENGDTSDVSSLVQSAQSRVFRQDQSIDTQAALLNSFPLVFKQKIELEFPPDIMETPDEIEEVVRKNITIRESTLPKDKQTYFHQLSSFGPRQVFSAVSETLYLINRQSSTHQTTKGLMTSGIFKSAIYSAKKLMKGWRGR